MCPPSAGYLGHFARCRDLRLQRESQALRSGAAGIEWATRSKQLTTATTSFWPGYPKENIRAKCNEHKVRGVQVNYKSAEKYVGDDAFDLLVLFPAGTAWEVHYDVSVR